MAGGLQAAGERGKGGDLRREDDRRTLPAMDPGLYAAFVAATVALIVLPGPNVGVIVATSLRHGRRAGLVTVAGTSAAMLPQLLLVVLGLTGALSLTGHLFEWVRWAGVAYLLALGIVAWRSPDSDPVEGQLPAPPSRSLLLRGAVVSLTNPKTLLFYGAFFPQFVTPGPNIADQLVLLAVTFLSVVTLLDCGWAMLAARLQRILAGSGSVRRRMEGGLYMAAAALLAGTRRVA